jgi:Zn-dependent protease
MNVTPEQIRWILIGVFVLVISVAIHEFGHAMMADKLGDDTPRRQGRVTLNPLAHADPIGTLLLPLIGGFYNAAGGLRGGFGWGKPVEWNPSRVSRRVSMSTASILVALAGPMMNVVLALVVATIHAILVWKGVVSLYSDVTQTAYSDPTKIMMFTVGTNFVLFFFNLVPAPPLDGGHVLQNLLPYRYKAGFDSFARFGPFVVMAVALIPQFAQIFLVPARFCTLHLYQLLGVL